MNYFQKKKLAFMSIVNRIKGFIRTVSGALPLTLEGCVDEESIIDYTLYGQSVQDGTPTPETPIEVESVGEKTRNLFNVNDDFDNKIVTSENNYRNYEMQLKPNTTYAVSVTENKQNAYVVISNGCVYKASNNKNVWLSHKTDSYLTLKPNKTLTFTTTENGLIYLCVATSSAASAFKTALTKCISGLQIEEGTTATDYEPYGYKIPIKVSGKNLFDMDNAMVSVDNWYYIGGSYSYGLNLEVGKQYGFSCDVINNPGVFIAAICRKPKIAGWSYTTLYRMVGQSSTTGKKSYTFVADGTECLWLYHSGGGGLNLYKKYITENIKNIQIEEGTTATDYEPYHEPITTNIYLDEPLRKVGDYADYIDFENGKVVRKIKKKQLTKADALYTLSGITGFYTYNFLDSGYSRIKGLSNREKTFTESWKDGTTLWLGVNTPVVYWIGILTKLGFTTLAEMNTWLKENETWIYWATKTPTETPITLPNIPTFKGTSIISADTTIQPSNVEITYYSNVKE